VDFDLILSCLRGAWEWRLGDNHALGWSITGGYAVAAVLAALVVLRAPFDADTRARERVFWLLVALFLLFMAVNKQLNLQTTLRVAGRCVAQTEGWYRARGEIQARFVLVLGASLAVLGLATLWWLRRAVRRNLPALAGCILLAGFVALRAAEIANVQQALRWDFLRIPVQRWVEIAGIALIVGGGLWALRRRGSGPRRR
jgi:hypothetical protein